MAEQSTNNNSNKTTKIIIIIGIIVIIALIGIIFALVLGKKDESVQESEQEAKRSVVVTEEKAEQVAEEMIHEEYIEPGYYECVMSTTWTFASGEAESEDSVVENVKANSNDVYFDLFLEDDEAETDPLYKSPIIPRGGKLENIKLDKSLSAGTYECIMVYHLVDENQKSLSELRVGLTIVVEN